MARGLGSRAPADGAAFPGPRPLDDDKVKETSCRGQAVDERVEAPAGLDAQTRSGAAASLLPAPPSAAILTPSSFGRVPPRRSPLRRGWMGVEPTAARCAAFRVPAAVSVGRPDLAPE